MLHLFPFPFTVHFISIEFVLSDHLSYVTIFDCSHGRSHKTGLTVYMYNETYLSCTKLGQLVFGIDRCSEKT
jgi:hypothetical protein